MATNTFAKFDVDGSGAIDVTEFSNLVLSLGVEFSEEEAEQAIAELDTDRSGVIELEEFVNWWVNRSKAVRKGGGLIAYKLKKIANKAAKMFYTDVHKAAWEGDLALVRLFLEAPGGGHLNAPDTSEYGNGWTPLHYACYQGHEQIVEELLAHSALINAKNDDGFTPLFYAAQQNFPSICQALIAAGADPSICGVVCNASKINSEAEAMEDMFFGIPPLCAADFVSGDYVHSNEDLRDIFAEHSKFVPPRQPEIDRAALSKVGVFSFDVADLAELSRLPVRKWKLTFYAGEELCAEYEARVTVQDSTVSHEPSQQHLLSIVTAAAEHNMTVEVAAVNPCGCSDPSYKTDVDVSQIFSTLVISD